VARVKEEELGYLIPPVRPDGLHDDDDDDDDGDGDDHHDDDDGAAANPSLCATIIL
jgi:hypothetical protein